jgi:hypothetical protein
VVSAISRSLGTRCLRGVVHQARDAPPRAGDISPPDELDRVRIDDAVPQRDSGRGIRHPRGDLGPRLAEEVKKRSIVRTDQGAEAVAHARRQRGTLAGG